MIKAKIYWRGKPRPAVRIPDTFLMVDFNNSEALQDAVVRAEQEQKLVVNSNLVESVEFFDETQARSDSQE